MKRHINIKGIPAIIWGEDSEKSFLAIHGDQSSKDDIVIEMFAEEAIKKGYMVLSFDLPGLGDRESEEEPNDVLSYINDLQIAFDYAKEISMEVSIFANSIGAYFSLLAYKNDRIVQALFLSPIIDMNKLLLKIMSWFEITDNQLFTKGMVETPFKNLYWEYYEYVKKNPIIYWNIPTSILYGSEDDLTELETIIDFAKRYSSEVKILNGSEHFFHTNEQFKYFRDWLAKEIK